MKKIKDKIAKSKLLCIVLIVCFTAVYLLATASFAQEQYETFAGFTTDGNPLDLHPDQLSYGDLWGMTEAEYKQTYYGAAQSSSTKTIYTDHSEKSKTASNKVYKYYGYLLIEDLKGVNGNSVPLATHTYKHFWNNYTSGTIEGVNGVDIPSLQTKSSSAPASYAVVPDSGGTYRIYVHSKENPINNVQYALVDNYQTYNLGFNGTSFTGSQQFAKFFQVPDTDWWYATVTIDNSKLTWEGYSPQYSTTTGKTDMDEGIGSKGTAPTTNTLLNNDETEYFLNKWTITTVQFKTLLVLQWNSNVSLGPITKEDTITITPGSNTVNQVTYTGSLTVTNVFGENIPANGQAQTTPHAPLLITPAANEGGGFKGFSGVDLEMENSIYKISFERTMSITGNWGMLDPLPTVTVSSDGSGAGGSTDFYAVPGFTAKYTAGVAQTYAITPDFTNASGAKITYKISEPGVDDRTGTLTSEITIPVKWDTVTVVLTATSANGETVKTCTVTIDSAAASSLAYVAKNLTTGMKYRYIEDAIMEAADGDTVVLIADATFRTAEQGQRKAWLVDNAGYTIGNGVTLLLPYSDGDLTIMPGTAQTNDYKHANVTFASSGGPTTNNMSPGKSVLHELTIPQGIQLEVADGTDSKYGRIVIGGTIIGTEGSCHYEGATYGAHSNIVVNGVLSLGDYSVLSIAGYVYGTGYIKTTGQNAEIYQPMVIRDWRGAGAAMLFVNSSITSPAEPIQSGEKKISPFTQWGTFNIQTQLFLNGGNYIYLYASLREGGDAYTSHPILVGDSNRSGFIELNKDACLTSEYQAITWSSDYEYAFPGKTYVTISGGASFGSLVMTVNLSTGNLDVNTNEFTTFISYCYDVALADGDYFIDNSIAFLPGTTLLVEENATLKIGTLANQAVRCMFIDGLVHRVQQANGSALSDISSKTHTVPYVDGRIDKRSYPTTAELQGSKCNGVALSADANLIVNGKLILGAKAALGGVVQTTANGIVDASSVEANTIPKGIVQIGITGAKSYLTVPRYCAGMVLYERTAQLVDRNGNRFDILGGNVYYSYYAESTQATYSFKYYAEANKPYNVVLVGDVTAASGETATTADACALNETIYGAWYIPTLPVHSTSAREDGMKIDAVYRLQDYVWLNAVCYLGDLNSAIANATSGIITTQIIDSTGKAWKNTFDLSTSKMTSEENGVQVLIVNGAVYLVKKISADEIPDKVTIVIMFNDGTMEYISAPVSVHLSECKNGDAKTDALVDSMLDYGDAAKLYFNSADAPDAKLELSLGSSYLAFKKIVNANGSHNGVTLVTKGANVLFEERLSLMFGFELSKTLAASDILQIGVLIGEPGKYTDQSPLTVAGYDKALIFYGVANEDVLSGNAPTLPANDIFKVDSKYALGTADELQDYLDESARMVVYMDLKSVEYTSAFEFRPFVITKNGTVLYGAQYAYGLADYINNMCSKTDDALQDAIGKDKNVDAFRNLLICTWDYALKADAKFNQTQGEGQ